MRISHGHGGHRYANARHATRFASAGGGGLQCVPFARNESGIELVGNAWTWWDEAAGIYQRGAAPEAGAVLAFRSNGSMRLGHVAVVTSVVNSREIVIDHANWSGGRVARDVSVVDVSPNNDWTAVRVALGRGDQFGSIYPTHGFIYDRPDQGIIRTASAHTTPVPDLNPAPRDLRSYAERGQSDSWSSDSDGVEEVAEAPATPTVVHRYVRHKHHHLR